MLYSNSFCISQYNENWYRDIGNFGLKKFPDFQNAVNALDRGKPPLLQRDVAQMLPRVRPSLQPDAQQHLPEDHQPEATQSPKNILNQKRRTCTVHVYFVSDLEVHLHHQSMHAYFDYAVSNSTWEVRVHMTMQGILC